MTIIIGTPYHPDGAYVFNRFLANQKQIQESYPDSELVLATSLIEYVDQLEQQLKAFRIKGKVLHYSFSKPDYAIFRIWDITAARNIIRLYALSKPEAEGLLFLDADMIFDPAVANILKEKMGQYDVIFSGYRLKDDWLAMSGFGCTLLSRKILKSVNFRCYEFKNRDALCEDEVLEFDLNRKWRKVKRGIFLNIDHYKRSNEALHIRPQPIPFINRLVNQSWIRYILVRLSILFQRNISFRTKKFIHKYIHPKIKA